MLFYYYLVNMFKYELEEIKFFFYEYYLLLENVGDI